MAYLTEDDVDLDGDTHAIARGDLGEVAIWSERHGFGWLTWPSPSLFMIYMMDPAPPSPDEQILVELLRASPEGLDVIDMDGDPLHDRVAVRLGPLEGMEIYAPTPVPARVHEALVETFVVADAMEWMEANYSGIAITLVDWLRDSPMLRRLREPWPQGGPRSPEREETCHDPRRPPRGDRDARGMQSRAGRLVPRPRLRIL